MNWRARHWCGLVAIVLAVCFAMVQPVLADANIRVTVSNPDNPSVPLYDGNTLTTAESAPTVSAGENQVFGTLSITGKTGVHIPVQVGDRIKIALSPGVCYMRTPTSINYRNYVTWPRQVGIEKNQICDGYGQPGMIFECATPHSMILRVGHIDSEATAMQLCLNFDKKDYSCARVAPFVTIADEWSADSQTRVSRLDFIKLLLIVVPDRYMGYGTSSLTMEQKFSDLGDVSIFDKEMIRPLVDSFVIRGYDGGFLKPHAYITRNEAFALVGRAFGYAATGGYRDKVASWGGASISYGARRMLYWGDPDGRFQGQKALTRSEALNIIQSCFETWSAGSDRMQGQVLGFR